MKGKRWLMLRSSVVWDNLSCETIYHSLDAAKSANTMLFISWAPYRKTTILTTQCVVELNFKAEVYQLHAAIQSRGCYKKQMRFYVWSKQSNTQRFNYGQTLTHSPIDYVDIMYVDVPTPAHVFAKKTTSYWYMDSIINLRRLRLDNQNVQNTYYNGPDSIFP